MKKYIDNSLIGTHINQEKKEETDDSKLKILKNINPDSREDIAVNKIQKIL